MIRRPPRSTLSSSSAASDVYKRQAQGWIRFVLAPTNSRRSGLKSRASKGELFNSLLVPFLRIGSRKPELHGSPFRHWLRLRPYDMTHPIGGVPKERRSRILAGTPDRPCRTEHSMP